MRNTYGKWCLVIIEFRFFYGAMRFVGGGEAPPPMTYAYPNYISRIECLVPGFRPGIILVALGPIGPIAWSLVHDVLNTPLSILLIYMTFLLLCHGKNIIIIFVFHFLFLLHSCRDIYPGQKFYYLIIARMRDCFIGIGFKEID